MPDASVRVWPAVCPSDATGVGARVGATDVDADATAGALLSGDAVTSGVATADDEAPPHPARRMTARKVAPRAAGRPDRGSCIAECYPPLADRPDTGEPAHDRRGRAGTRRGRSADAGDARPVPHPDGAR